MKRFTSFLLIMMLVLASMFSMTACMSNEEDLEENDHQLKLYFINNEYVETGETTVGALVLYEGVYIDLLEEGEEGYNEETKEQTYTSAITNLWEVPAELPNAMTLVTEDILFHGVTVEDGVAYVDICSEDLTQGGSMEETLFISQVVETLVNSFDEIEKVQFMVDGEIVETLMGHCYVAEPLEKGFS